MRKIIVLSFLSLDGVMQAPGGRQEDTSGDFLYGGWSAPYADAVTGEVMQKQMAPTDILLGRKTFDIFADYWPKHAEHWPGINEVTKYVLSNTLTTSPWQNSVFLKDVEAVRELKNSEGGDLKVWGSSELVKLLLKHDLADELWLKIYPVLLGKGKKLYDDELKAGSFTLFDSAVTPSGVIVANYRRAGEVQTGTMGPQD